VHLLRELIAAGDHDAVLHAVHSSSCMCCYDVTLAARADVLGSYHSTEEKVEMYLDT
jgi:hypothetical protein